MADNFTIVGLRECEDFIGKAPDRMLKLTQKCMRKASSQVVRRMKKGIPSRYRSLVRSKVTKTYKGTLSAGIGLFNTGARSQNDKNGGEASDWFKAYWSNYGTLQNRDPSHHFKYKRKKISAAWKGGIRQQNFYDRAVEGYERTFIDAFNKAMQDNMKDMESK